MGLSQSQRSILERARSVGTSDLAVALDDEMCAYLLGVIVHDLNLQRHFPELPVAIPKFFSAVPPKDLRLRGINFDGLIERLAGIESDAITYFSCLATMHKARLKYFKILERQPVPTMDQVGPRGLLQFGQMSAAALAGLILWRKWLYDIDNRAAQETGYLFQPIIAHAIGGISVSARRSPVRRHGDRTKGREVDCLREKRAYEIKIRITIAASGQGRWKEELDYAKDCRASGYTPVLIVFDPTPNAKLSHIKTAFEKADGEVYIGDAAWQHLNKAAGTTMARFIEQYIRRPMEAILSEVTVGSLPQIQLSMEKERLRIRIDSEEISVQRTSDDGELATDGDALPEDVDEEFPGA